MHTSQPASVTTSFAAYLLHAECVHDMNMALYRDGGVCDSLGCMHSYDVSR